MILLLFLLERVWCQSVCSNNSDDFIKCSNDVGQLYDDCIGDCPRGDAVCLTKCARAYDQALVECPCQSGCPDGCPCPVYQCPMPTIDSILVLNSAYGGHNPAITINMDGGFETTRFQFGADTTTYASCSVVIRNEVYVYGGGEYDKKRQISQIDNCQLRHVGTLPFDLDYGTCTLANKNIVWCFDYVNTRSCWYSTSPTSGWKQVDQANFDHRKIRIAASEKSIFAVGNAKGAHSHAELLDVSSWSWSVRQSYPFAAKIYSAASVYVNDYFVVFGGIDGSGGTTIARYDASGDDWHGMGQLKSGRDGHAVIVTGSDTVLVVGGNGNQMTEKCTVDGDSINCVGQAPYLDDYASYPELFIVSNPYCSILMNTL